MIKDSTEVEAEEILTSFKEFILIFYGASWSDRSIHISNAITELLIRQNPDDENQAPLYEVIYISNDYDKSEFKNFYEQMCEETPWCTLQFTDKNVINIKNEFKFESLPQVVVLDKNLQVITTEGADDLATMDVDVCRTLWLSMLNKKLLEGGSGIKSDHE